MNQLPGDDVSQSTLFWLLQTPTARYCSPPKTVELNSTSSLPSHVHYYHSQSLLTVKQPWHVYNDVKRIK